MTDQQLRTPDTREAPSRTQPHDDDRRDRSDRGHDRDEPLLREGPDAPDAADIEDPEHQR
jgi:hypothetical protein